VRKAWLARDSSVRAEARRKLRVSTRPDSETECRKVRCCNLSFVGQTRSLIWNARCVSGIRHGGINALVRRLSRHDQELFAEIRQATGSFR
jgi:hypothetical protein